jgi:hypothetical protein
LTRSEDADCALPREEPMLGSLLGFFNHRIFSRLTPRGNGNPIRTAILSRLARISYKTCAILGIRQHELSPHLQSIHLHPRFSGSWDDLYSSSHSSRYPFLQLAATPRRNSVERQDRRNLIYQQFADTRGQLVG